MSESRNIEVSVSPDAATVLSEVASLFENEGRIVRDSEAGTSPYPRISGVLGSGFLKMNPTLVHVEVVGVTEDACTLLVSGAAKEGLIKQRSAQKAVVRIAEYLGKTA